jgi:nucleoid DNA-binding protein
MKLAELTQAVNAQSSIEPQAVQKVLEAAFAILGEELTKAEKVEIQGLGTFVRKPSRKSGKEARTLFKSWVVAGTKTEQGRTGKGRKKAKKRQKRKKENFP